MKTFDEYWEKHATDEFLSKEGVKTLCDDMLKDLQHYKDTTQNLWAIDRNPREVSKEWIEENAFQL